jgi:hypothetical protein
MQEVVETSEFDLIVIDTVLEVVSTLSLSGLKKKEPNQETRCCQ